MKMVTVYLLGKMFSVPEDLTIMRAMEYSGFRLVRGCGCRSGFCGACAVVYRLKGQTETHSALACQTKVEDGMCVGRLESFPIKRWNTIWMIFPLPATSSASFILKSITASIVMPARETVLRESKS